jgi:xenotropic and polytropic retrovirus receptor 1
MVIDPIMRSSWLFYVAFPGQKQHSAATSFFIALGEVFRRFIWNFFRMENEHMTNVGHFLASRDVPLPFSLPSPSSGVTLEAQPPAPVERRLATKTMGSMRRGMVRMTTSLRVKHAEDFGRRPGHEKGPQKGKMPDETTDFSSDNDGRRESDGIHGSDREER